MFDLAVLRKVLKPRFYKGDLPDATLKEFPFLGLVNTDDDFSGSEYWSPIKYAHAQGRSRLFPNAVANNGTPAYTKWVLDVVPDYFNSQVPRQAALRTRDSTQYVKLFVDAIEDGKQVVNENTAQALYGTSGGSRARISHTTLLNTAALTLSDPVMATNLDVGMAINLGPNADGTALHGAPDVVTLGAVDRVNGIIYTANGLAWNNIANCAAIAVDDYLFQDGDATVSIHGLPDWVLAAPPTPGATFNGVDRYTDTRLYGNYYNATSFTVAEGLRRALSFNRTMGGKCDRVLLASSDYDNLEIDLVSTGFLRRETAPGSKATFGFSGIEIDYGTGKAICIPDVKHTLRGRAWLLEMSTWHLTYMNGGKGPGAIIIDDDGQYIRLANADAFDCRCGDFAQLWCEKPGANCACDISL